MNYNDYFAKFEDNPEYVKAKKDLRFKFRLARAVLYARMAKGWSQSELARRVETKQANISRIEASLANPTFDLIRRLCDVLEIEVTFSGPSILDGTLAYKQSETTSGTVVEEYYRVDDQVGNVFCGSFDTKTGKTSESEVLN